MKNRQVEISNLLKQLEENLKTIHSLYMKLCNVEFFTLENQLSINLLQVDMKECTLSLGKNSSSISPSYTNLTFGQQRLAEFMATNSDMRIKLIMTKFMLLPHLEIVQMELSTAQTL